MRLTNDRLGAYVELEYDTTQFPCFFQWLHLREGAYAMGPEPSTNHVEGELAAREDGTLCWLQPGAERYYRSVIRVGSIA